MKVRCVCVGLATSGCNCFCRETRTNQDNAFDLQMYYYLFKMATKRALLEQKSQMLCVPQVRERTVIMHLCGAVPAFSPSFLSIS